MKRAVVSGNQAYWHTDIQWNQVLWTISSSGKLISEWMRVSKNWDLVSFPSHPHALDIHWSPIDYRTHSIAVSGTGKLQITNSKCVVDLDNVPVWDEAGPDAQMHATQFKLLSN